MDVQLRIGGISVARSASGSTVSMGLNTVTNGNMSKTNEGIAVIGDRAAVTQMDTTENVDNDQVDQVNIQMDNIALGPF